MANVLNLTQLNMASLEYTLIIDKEVIKVIEDFCEEAEKLFECLDSIDTISNERKDFFARKFKSLVKRISQEMICETVQKEVHGKN